MNRLRPVVIMDLVTELPLVYLSIKNFGPTAARNVKFQVTPPVRSLYGPYGGKVVEREEAIPVIENGIPMLPPGKEIRGLVGHWVHVNTYNPKQLFVGKISYDSADGSAHYPEEIIIDLSSEERLRHIHRNTIHDLTKAVDALRADIHDIATGSSQPLTRVISETDYQEGLDEEIQATHRSLEEISSPQQNTESEG